MLLRVITIVAVVIGLVFVAWSLLVMTGGRDWLVAAVTTEAPKAPAKEKPPAKEGATGEAKPGEEAKPAQDSEPTEDMKPTDATEAEGGAADKEPAKQTTEKPADAAGGGVDPAGNPLETAKAAETGSLTSPYQDDYESVAEEGHKKYMAAGCNGCHGGTGGGGMGPLPSGSTAMTATRCSV